MKWLRHGFFLQVMKQLSSKVSIVPVIAKADCLTRQEISRLKQKVLEEITVCVLTLGVWIRVLMRLFILGPYSSWYGIHFFNFSSFLDSFWFFFSLEAKNSQYCNNKKIRKKFQAITACPKVISLTSIFIITLINLQEKNKYLFQVSVPHVGTLLSPNSCVG